VQARNTADRQQCATLSTRMHQSLNIQGTQFCDNLRHSDSPTTYPTKTV
jgi:hypothetical protein